MSPVAPRVHFVRAALIIAMNVFALLAIAGPAHAATPQTVGIHAHILWSDVGAAEMRRQLDLAKGAGAQIMRVDVGWSSLEQNGKGQYSPWYLGRLDDLVTQADQRHIKLLLTVADTPCWASSAPETLKQGCAGAWWDRGVQRYTPTAPRDYGDAFAFLIRRYGSRVAAWEIGNEPNSPDYYKAANPVTDYVALVKEAYGSGKAADPKARILAGAVMQSDFEYVEKLYKAGIKGSFDAFSIHPYCEDRSPMDPWKTEWMRLSFIRGVPKVHDVMLDYGDHSPMWFTEFGWSTSTTRNVSSQADGVDEQVQAGDVKLALAQVPRWSYVEAAIYYNLINSGDDRASLYGNYGLVRYDRSLKPGYAAFKKAAKNFTGTAASAPSESSSAGQTQAGASLPATVTVPAPSAPAAPAAKAPKARKSGSLSVRRVGRGLRIAGASIPRAKIRLRIFRMRHGRRVSRPSLTLQTRARASGRFVLVTRDSRLKHGAWRVIASQLT
jgi:polysaccharide biosynthesis protein PslG